MNKLLYVPIIISLIVLSVAGVFGLYISKYIELSNNEKLQNIFCLIAASSGIIATTFVLYSYIQTNSAFVDSQRPSLLVQVDSPHMTDPARPAFLRPFTRIHYKNVTGNTFADLSFNIRVFTNDKSVDISDLFRPTMNMPAYDTRQRNFDTIDELQKKGINILEEARPDNKIKLEISYSYTYMGKKEKILAQIYEWDIAKRIWNIF